MENPLQTYISARRSVVTRELTPDRRQRRRSWPRPSGWLLETPSLYKCSPASRSSCATGLARLCLARYNPHLRALSLVVVCVACMCLDDTQNKQDKFLNKGRGPEPMQAVPAWSLIKTSALAEPKIISAFVVTSQPWVFLDMLPSCQHAPAHPDRRLRRQREWSHHHYRSAGPQTHVARRRGETAERHPVESTVFVGGR